MPTVLRHGPYRLFFYASDRKEPPHVHVGRDDNEAKFWLAPPRLRRNRGFKQRDLNEIERIIEQNQERLMRSWDEYFSG